MGDGGRGGVGIGRETRRERSISLEREGRDHEV